MSKTKITQSLLLLLVVMPVSVLARADQKKNNNPPPPPKPAPAARPAPSTGVKSGNAEARPAGGAGQGLKARGGSGGSGGAKASGGGGAKVGAVEESRAAELEGLSLGALGRARVAFLTRGVPASNRRTDQEGEKYTATLRPIRQSPRTRTGIYSGLKLLAAWPALTRW